MCAYVIHAHTLIHTQRMYIYMYVYVHTVTHSYITTYVLTHMHTHTYIHTYRIAGKFGRGKVW